MQHVTVNSCSRGLSGTIRGLLVVGFVCLIGSLGAGTTYCWKYDNTSKFYNWGDASSWLVGTNGTGDVATTCPGAEDDIDAGCAEGKLYANLGGQSWTVANIVNTRRDWKVNYVRLTNGTLTVTGDAGLRMSNVTLQDATLKTTATNGLHTGDSGVYTRLTLNFGSRAELAHPISIYGAYLTVDATSTLVFDPCLLQWNSNAQNTRSGLSNAGTATFPHGFVLKGSGSINYKEQHFALSNQIGGTLNFTGAVRRDYGTVAEANRRGTFELILAGGTANFDGTPGFENVTGTLADDAALAVSATAGSTVDFSGFDCGSNVRLAFTGAGAINVGSLALSSLTVDGGTFVVANPDAPIPAFATFAKGTNLRIALADGFTIPAGFVATDYSYEVDPNAVAAGNPIIRSTDSAVLDAVYQRMKAISGIVYEKQDGAIVYQVRTAPVVSTWTGAGGDARWVNAANWSGDVPGVHTNELGLVTQSDNDTAVFTTGSAATAIDLTGLIAISNVTVTGAGAPCYTFGTSSAQMLCLEAFGTIRVDADVPAAPVIAATLGLGRNRTDKAGTYYVDNDSSELTIGNIGHGANVTSWAADVLCLRGGGSVRITGSSDLAPHALRVYEEQTYDAASGRGILTVAGTLSLHKFFVQSGSASRRIEVAAGGTLSLVPGGCFDLLGVDRDTVIAGEGRLILACQFKGGVWENGSVNAASGKTLTIACPVFSQAIAAGSVPFVPGARINGSGTVEFTGSNEIAGEMRLQGSGRLVAQTIGKKGVQSSLGLGDSVLVSESGWLRYTGEGETTDRTIVLSNGVGKIEHAGTGDLHLTGELVTAIKPQLYLYNTPVGGVTAEGYWDGVIGDNPTPVSVRKMSEGRWTLTGANTYSGATVVEAGTLRLQGAGTFGNTSKLTVLNGSSIEIDRENAALSLAAVEIGAGANTITLAAGTTLQIASLARTTDTAGQLNIVAAAGASVSVAGMTETSDSPVWVTLNGRAVGFDASGKVVKRLLSIDTAIPARGGVVPNDATKNVGITTAGTEGHVTLEDGGSVAVKALAQMSGTKAEVEIPEGQTLTTEGLYVDESAETLTVGGFAADGTLVAADGALTLYPEGETSDLTIKAPLTATAITKVGEGTARLTRAWSGTADIQRGTFAQTNVSTVTATLKGTGTYALEGGDTFDLTKAQTSFTGTFEVRGGLARPTVATAFGATDSMDYGTVNVASNAAVDLVSAGKTMSYGNKEFRIAGSGPDGNGALRSSTASTATIGGLSLAGDATVRTAGTYLHVWGTSGRAAQIDFGGHALVKEGAGLMTFKYASLTNAGPLTIADQPGTASSVGLVLYDGTDLGDEKDPPVRIGTGGVIYLGTSFAPGSAPYRRRLIASGTNPAVNTWATGVYTNKNAWAGPIEIETAETTLRFAPYASEYDNLVTILGKISGPGSIEVSNRGNVFIGHPENDFEGRFAFLGTGNATVTFAYPGSLPDYGRLVATNGRVTVVHTGAEGANWRQADIFKLANEAVLESDSPGSLPRAIVAVDASAAPERTCRLALTDADITRTDRERFALGADKGRTELSGSFTSIGALGAFRGTLAVTGGSTRTFGDGVASSDGTNEIGILSFEGGSTSRFTGGIYVGQLGWNFDSVGIVSVANAALYSDTTPETGIFPRFTLGFRQNTGILRVGSGANLSVGLYAGASSSYSRGAVHMTGGSLRLWGNAVQPVILSGSIDSYAYVGVEGGDFETSGFTELAAHATDDVRSQGLVYQLGGTYRHNKRGSTEAALMWRIGGPAGSVATVYRNGGTMKVDGQIYLINQCEGFTNGLVQWTQGPLCGRAECDEQVILSANDRATSILNLNGGVLAATRLYKYGAATDNRAYVNFDGGAVETKADDSLFGHGNDSTSAAVDRVTVFGGGATIIVSNALTTLDVALEAPTGNGVSAIPAPAWAIKGDRFAGPPTVEIYDAAGTGFGASAIVEYDAATLKPGAVVVTSKGCDYTQPMARFRYGTNVWIAACETAPAETAGGLVKAGAGTLRLNAANAYAGTTTVRDGVLQPTVAGAIPATSDIILDGGILDLNGQDISLDRITFRAGGLKNSNGALPLPTTLTISMADLKNGKSFVFDGDTDFSAGLTITITDATAADFADADAVYPLVRVTGEVTAFDQVACSVPGVDVGAFRLVNAGGVISLRQPKGLILLVR